MYQGHNYKKEHAPKCDDSMRKSAKKLIENALAETKNEDKPKRIVNEVDRGKILTFKQFYNGHLHFRRGVELITPRKR